MNDQDRSSNLPTILVVLLALFGLATIPRAPGGRGGGSSGNGPPAAEEVASGHPSTDEADEDSPKLGPLLPLREYWRGADNRGRDLRSRDELLERSERLRFLIVTVPDPDDTSVSHAFDSTLGAVLRAVERQEYLAQYRNLPWDPEAYVKPGRSDKTAGGTITAATGLGTKAEATAARKAEVPECLKPRWPGSILCCRSSDDHTTQEELLLLLLVPETPTWGIGKEQLRQAVCLVNQHRKVHPKRYTEPWEKPIRVVGPMYSGSFTSLSHALGPLPPRPQGSPPEFVIYNGSAVSPPLDMFEKAFPKASVKLRSTVHQNRELVVELTKFLQETSPSGKGPGRVALLVESGTLFGLQSSASTQDGEPSAKAPKEQEPDVFKFPMGISRIRQEYTAKGIYASKEPVRLAAPERLSLQSLTGHTGDRDLMPVFAPGAAVVEGDVLLAQTLQELERGRYSVIGIIATNDYDRLFLASRVREFCPDARLSFTASTCLYTHHDMVPYLRGSLVASTYPLQLANQQWAPAPKTKDEDLKVLPRKVPPHVAFPHDNVEGIYNAVLANLSEMMNRRNPPLLDYSFPGEPLATKTVPPIWISVVGERGLYPLKVVPGDTPSRKDTGDENGGLYRLPEVGKPEQHRLTPRLDPNWVAVFLAVALAGAAGSLWYLWACLAPKAGTAAAEGWPGWLQVGPGLHESVNSPAGRRLAALATTSLLALVVLQGMPAWAFAALMVTSGGDVGLASDTVPVLLGGVVAFVAGVAASLVALVVLIMNYGGGPVKRGDRLSQLIVGLVALLQVAVLPICAAHALFQPREPATSLWTVESAGLRLDCERMSRLTAGVTPLLPLLLLSLAEAAAMAGGWRRLVLLARLRAAKVPAQVPRLADTAAAVALGRVRCDLAAVPDLLDAPLSTGAITDPVVFLALAGSTLVGVYVAADLPGSVERRSLQWVFLLAFGLTLIMVLLRLVELIGLWRVTSRLLRTTADLPMVRAFGRLPSRVGSHVAVEPEPSSPAPAPGDISDPFIDRQFQTLAANYGRVLPLLRGLDSRGGDEGEADPFAPWHGHLRGDGDGECGPRLPPADWWPVVDTMLPALAYFWARRPLAASFGERPEGAEEWPGLTDLAASRGDSDGRAGDHHNVGELAPHAEAHGHVPAGGTATQALLVAPLTRPEELGCWLRDAEDFLALVLARELNWLRRGCWSIVGVVVASLLSLTLALVSYPFQPRGRFLTALSLLAAVSGTVVMAIAVRSSRDEVVSRLTGTAPNRLTFDRELVMRLVTCVVPLLGLLVALSYGASDLVRSWFEPLFR